MRKEHVPLESIHRFNADDNSSPELQRPEDENVQRQREIAHWGAPVEKGIEADIN